MSETVNRACLSGALDCQREMVSYKLGVPPVRQLVENTGVWPEKWEGSMPSRNSKGEFEINKSLDSWEYPTFLLEHDLATEWKGDFNDPEQRKTIPLGSLAFQGRSDSNYGGTRKQYTQEPSQRHTAASIRFNDEGEVLFYDFGDLESGEGLMYPTEVERIIIPKGYEDFTYDKLKSGHEKYIEALGYPEDYTPEELLAIFEKMCEENCYKVNLQAREVLLDKFKELYINRTSNFGNGRLARNIFEKTIEQQASRLSKINNISKDMMIEIISEDILV